MTVLELTLYWFFQVPVCDGASQIGVSKECAIDWYNYCREVCMTVYADQDICIGGPGFNVEMDESHLWRRKYHRGDLLVNEDQWVFGGICRETKETFIQIVPDRTGVTLWPIINQKVHPDTVIATGCARVYDNLHLPPRGNYVHYQVNHSENFVDPNDRNIQTNTIERQWGLLKKQSRDTGMTSISLYTLVRNLTDLTTPDLTTRTLTDLTD